MASSAFESAIGSYMDSIQIIPLEMQGRITNYLQSELQERNLLMLSNYMVKKVGESKDISCKKKYLTQLLYVLVAIQGLCDFRVNDLDELNDIVESHMQRLMNNWAKINSKISQTSQSCADKNSDDASNSNCQGEFDERLNEKASLIRRSIVQDFPSTKALRDSVNDRNVELNSRGRDRFTTRAVANTNSRANSRRALSRWASGIHHRRKSTTPATPVSSHMMKQRTVTDSRTSQRTVLEPQQRPHKLSTTYARYTRAQQQRMKSRVLPRSMQSDRARPQNMNEFMGHGRKRKANMSKYMTMNRKGASAMSGRKRRLGFYYSESQYNLPSIQSMTDDDDHRSDEREALLELRKTTRSPNWIEHSNEISCRHDLGDDSDDSEYLDKHDVGSLKSSHDHQNLRISPVNADTGHQRLYRLRRNSITNSPDVSSLSSVSYVPTHNSTCYYTSRRGYRAGGVCRLKNDNQLRRTSPDSPRKLDDVSGSRNKSSSHSPTRCHTSDENLSPDERLYCVCRKVSFGEMIACDNKCCEVEWFHFSCVDVRVQPKGKWYCPYCRGESSKIKRSDL